MLLAVTCLVSSCYCGSAPSLEDVISLRDQQRLKQLFKEAEIVDLATAHYVVGGLNFLGSDKKVVLVENRAIFTHRCATRRWKIRPVIS